MTHCRVVQDNGEGITGLSCEEGGIDRVFAIGDHAGMRLEIEIQALRALLRMPKSDAGGLRAKLREFAAAPYDPHPWAKSFGSGQGRIRHGDWRAVYRIDGDVLVVTVLKIGNRREIYR